MNRVVIYTASREGRSLKSAHVAKSSAPPVDLMRSARSVYRALRRSGSLPFEARMTVIDLLWLGRATTWTKERAA